MDNVVTKKSELEDVDLYKAQERYGRYMAKKRMAYTIMFALASVISLVVMFVIPMYSYHSLGKKRNGPPKIIGEYTAEYIIEKYFNLTLGPKALLNTCLVIVLAAMIIMAAYVAVGGVLNLVAKKVLEKNKIIGKLFNYGMLEVISSSLFVALMASMMLAKIDLSGNVDNATGFWIVFVASLVMICTSIPLSDKKVD